MEDLEATPRRIIDTNNRNFLHASSPSPSPSPFLSPSPLRLWRPVEQRNIRNQWSKLLSVKNRWFSASSNGKLHATSIVNASLSKELGRRALLSCYKDMVLAVSQMVKASKSMRCHLKGSAGSPFLQFCERPEVMNDSGDGGRIPVFLSFALFDLEELAEELVAMFVLELALMRLLVVELTSMQLEKEVDKIGTDTKVKELFEGELNELRISGLLSDENCEILTTNINELVGVSLDSCSFGHESSETVLQVYLTSCLANVNLNSSRIDEIFMVVEETMQVKL